MDLSASTTRTLTVPTDLDTAWALIADVPRSVAHFPGLERFEHVGEADWRWSLQKLGAGKLTLQTVYTCRYELDEAARIVRWTALSAPGDNARVEGSWTLRPAGSGTALTLRNDLTLVIDLPRLMRRPAEALVARENTRLIDGYVANLGQTLRGSDGRVR